MNGNLSVQITGGLSATLQKTNVTDIITDVFTQPVALTLTNGGLGVGVANQIFSGQFTVGANSSTLYDISFSGTNDNVGNPLNLEAVKLLYFSQSGTTILSNLYVTSTVANGWTSAFSGTHTLLGDAGYMLLANSGLLGFPVSSSNKMLSIVNTNSWDVTYTMVVVGANGTN